MGTMAFGHSRGVMAIFLTISVSFAESAILMFVKFLMLILILASVVVQILTTSSNSGLKIAKRLFKLSTIERL